MVLYKIYVIGRMVKAVCLRYFNASALSLCVYKITHYYGKSNMEYSTKESFLNAAKRRNFSFQLTKIKLLCYTKSVGLL